MSPTEVTITLDPGQVLTPTVEWTPTMGGSHCIQVILEDVDGQYEPQRSQRNVDVVERPPCGETRTYSFTIYNDSPLAQTVDIGLITFNVPEEWEVSTDPSGSVQLGPYQQMEVEVTVLIPCASDVQALHEQMQVAALQRAAGSVPTIDVEGYIDGELVGGIEIQFGPDETRWLYLPVIISQ